MARRYYKVVVVGDENTGKTSLLEVFAEEQTMSRNNVYSFERKESNGTITTVSMWDTVGGSEYDRLRPLSYPRTDVFALCFSVIKPEQLQRIREYWFPNLQHHAPWAGIILIGTHQDIRDAVETASPSDGEKVTPISFSEAQALANELGAMSYIETSTSDKESVRKLYDMLLSASLKHSSPTQIQDKSKKKRQARCAIM